MSKTDQMPLYSAVRSDNGGVGPLDPVKAANRAIKHASTSSSPPNSNASSPLHLPLGGNRTPEKTENCCPSDDPMEAPPEPDWFEVHQTELKNDDLLNQQSERLQIAIKNALAARDIILEKYSARMDAPRSEKTADIYHRRYLSISKSLNAFDLRNYTGGNRRKVHTILVLGLSAEIDQVLYYWNEVCDQSDLSERENALRAFEFCGDAAERLSETSHQASFRKAPPRQRYWERIKKLPRGWEFTLEAKARAHLIWYLPICLMLSTGCRPEEIALGVEVRTLSPGLVEVRIRPAKLRKSNDVGLGVRCMTLRADTPWTAALVEALGNEDVLCVKIKSPKKAYDRVTEIMADLFGKPGKLVGPRVLRHRFASMLKDTDLPLRDMLVMMGHADPVSFQRYGRPNLNVASVGLPVTWSAELEPKMERE